MGDNYDYPNIKTWKQTSHHNTLSSSFHASSGRSLNTIQAHLLLNSCTTREGSPLPLTARSQRAGWGLNQQPQKLAAKIFQLSHSTSPITPHCELVLNSKWLAVFSILKNTKAQIWPWEGEQLHKWLNIMSQNMKKNNTEFDISPGRLSTNQYLSLWQSDKVFVRFLVQLWPRLC